MGGKWQTGSGSREAVVGKRKAEGRSLLFVLCFLFSDFRFPIADSLGLLQNNLLIQQRIHFLIKIAQHRVGVYGEPTGAILDLNFCLDTIVIHNYLA